MTITDLIIFDHHNRRPLWAYVLPFFYKPPSSHKGRGLGSAMLNFVIQTAQVMEASEIRGWITHSDLEATPYLPAFYRKHGFTVNSDDMRFYQILD